MVKKKKGIGNEENKLFENMKDMIVGLLKSMEIQENLIKSSSFNVK